MNHSSTLSQQESRNRNSRVLIESSPFIVPELEGQWHFGGRGRWPCPWIEPSVPVSAPFVAAYRLRFQVEEAAQVRVHVSADERYALWLDGELVGRGPERGDRDHWFFDSYDLDFAAGEHVLVARVSNLGELAEVSQMTVRHGFLLAPSEEKWRDTLGTGHANWEFQILDGLTFSTPEIPDYYYACGPVAEVDAALFPWNYHLGEGENWRRVQKGAPAVEADFATESSLIHGLRPASLPPQIERSFRPGCVRWIAQSPNHEPVNLALHRVDEAPAWQNLLAHDQAFTIEAHTQRRVLIDLENYYCAFSRIEVSGGAGGFLALKWAEALYQDEQMTFKGNRDEIEVCFFVGIGDTLRLDGGPNRVWEPLEWSAGRYVEVQIETGDEPLVLERLHFKESRYPLELEGTVATGDDELQKVWPILVRGVQMCAHETYMDCPFYERLMYAGDTRLQMLATFVMTGDDALPRRALQSFAWSRVCGEALDGLTQSRYPSRLRQVIPPFALWWVTMLHDFALWRGDPAFVDQLMPTARGVLDAMRRFCNSDGLLEAPNGWNFVDWVPTWEHGIPADGVRGVGGPMNWTYAHALHAMAELERWRNEPELANRWQRQREGVVEGLGSFWDEKRGLFSDDKNHRHFSEHANALALAGGFLDPQRAERVAGSLIEAPDLARTTIYFSHYLLEAWHQTRRSEALWKTLDLWRDLPNQGFVTPFEQSDFRTTRSDCHAWGSHPLFHFFASVLGIRPTAPGFSRVEIAPQLESLPWARGTFPHPQGLIHADLSLDGEAVVGTVSLPQGVEVTVVPPGVQILRN